MPATIPSSESALPWLSGTDLRVGAKPVAPSSALVDGSWAPRPKALGFRFRRRSQWLGHRLLLQRVIEHFVARLAPSTFSLTPPIGSTTPERVISPVMARRSFTGRPLSRLTSAVTMAAPAEGPSFGTAPDGTWM